MSTYEQHPVATPPLGTGSQEPGTADQAKQAAGTAAQESKHVAEVAKDQAAAVVSDVGAEARDLLAQARSQVEQQSRGQLENLVQTLSSFATDLESMARGEGTGSGLAQDVVQQVGDRARGLSSQLQGRDPSELLDQARDFARRRPGTFLLGALAAGVVAGRLARGAKDAQSSDSAPSAVTPAQPHSAVGTVTTTPGAAATPPPPAYPGTATADPLAGTGIPPSPPSYPEGSPTSGTQWGTP